MKRARNPKNIPAGFALSLESWENDADFYKTQVFYGLTEVDVNFLLSLAKLFYSMHSFKSKGFGGGSWHYKDGTGLYYTDVYAAIDKVVADFSDKGVTPELLAKWTVEREAVEADDDDGDDIQNDELNELITELVGYPEEEMYQTDGYIRVFDNHTVIYYAQEVEDVTARFE